MQSLHFLFIISAASVFHLSFTSSFISRSCPMVTLLFDYSGGVLSRCMRIMAKNKDLSYNQCVRLRLTSRNPTNPPGVPACSTAGVADCNYYGRFTVLPQGCWASSKGHWGYRIYAMYEVCELHKVLSSGVQLCPYLCL